MPCNLQSSLLTDLKIGKKSTFKKPASWPNITKNTQNSHIYLLADTRYPIGFSATAIGGYSVNIDGEHYADYNSQAQFSMADWSAYTDTEGYIIDYPTNATKAHIIDIYPQTEGNNITAFHCARIAASGEETQGILWAHFNISNTINLTKGFAQYNTYKNPIMEAVTVKRDVLKVSGLDSCFYSATNLSYIPLIDCQKIEMSFYGLLWNTTKLKQIIFKNAVPNSLQYFAYSSYIEEVKGTIDFSKVATAAYGFMSASKLKRLPTKNFSSLLTGGAQGFIGYCYALEDTYLNLSPCSGITKFEAYNTSKFKGLRVSEEAPFNHQTSPQINISNTGLNRAALITLFNDLPTVSSGQIINITGCSGIADLTDEDKAIATNKGWTIAE